MGTNTLNALALMTVRLAMRPINLDSDTAMVWPSQLLTCCMT